MLDPFSPLFHAHHSAPSTVTVDMMPDAGDPASAHTLMIIGVIIVMATAFWVIGALGAAVGVGLNRRRNRGFRSPGA
jgi:hypothetical protein